MVKKAYNAAKRAHNDHVAQTCPDLAKAADEITEDRYCDAWRGVVMLLASIQVGPHIKKIRKLTGLSENFILNGSWYARRNGIFHGDQVVALPEWERQPLSLLFDAMVCAGEVVARGVGDERTYRIRGQLDYTEHADDVLNTNPAFFIPWCGSRENTVEKCKQPKGFTYDGFVEAVVHHCAPRTKGQPGTWLARLAVSERLPELVREVESTDSETEDVEEVSMAWDVDDEEYSEAAEDEDLYITVPCARLNCGLCPGCEHHCHRDGVVRIATSRHSYYEGGRATHRRVGKRQVGKKPES